MEKPRLDALTSFTMLDGSQIRELAGSAWTPAERRSLAGATPPLGPGDGRAPASERHRNDGALS